ncbi:MAG: TolC family protein, partial [Algicola sp.]|nr:TolC family protein [Algicola sp.]
IRLDSYLQTITDRRTQVDGFGYQFSVTQPLFNLPAYYNYQRGAGVAARAQLQKVQAKSDFIDLFSQTYLEIVANSLRIQNINETLGAYEAQRDLIAKQYETGFVKPSDLQQAEASLATLKSQAIVVKNNLSVSFSALELLLQTDVAAVHGLIEALDKIDVLDKTLASYVMKFKDNVDYKVAKANVNIADKELKANSSLSMPSVAASLRYSDNHLENTFDYQSNNTLYQDGVTFAVQLTIQLYAGGGDTYRKRASAYSYESSKLQKQFIEHQTQQAIRTTYLNLKAGLALVNSRKKSVSASRVALDNANLEYRTGIGQYADVRTSQDRLFEETNSLIVDKVTLINNYFVLARLTGEEPDMTVKNMKIIFTGEVINNEG